MTKNNTFVPALRIAIDGNEANVAQRVGSNVYAFEIIKALETIAQKTEVQITVLLATEPLKDLPKARAGWRYQVIKPSFLWTQLAVSLHLFLHQGCYDVFFTPGHYAPRLSAVPYVSSVMDLAFLKYPHQFKSKDYVQLRDWTAYSVKNARKIITISEASKADILKQYHRKESDVIIAYPALSQEIVEVTQAEVKDLTQKLGITAPYFLYVGTLQPRKNLLRLLDAFERVESLVTHQNRNLKLRSKFKLKALSDFRDVQLVLAGKLGWLTEELVAKVKNSPISHKIILTGYIDEETKTALYQGAQASVLVGLYEGFGIPPLESLHHGTVPVVSQTTSLPEVVGDGGILVNPESVSAIADGLLNALLLTAQERARLRRNGRKQLQKFAWKTSAQVILEVLTQVARQK